MSLSKDRQVDIWLLTPRGPARVSNGMISRITPRDGLPEARATAVCGSSPAGVLVAGRSGIYRFVNGRFEPLPSIPQPNNGVADYLLCGSDGAVWWAVARV